MQTVVGVLRGGPSREHEVSLATGSAMLSALSPERFIARDIYIDKNGQWHDRGRAVSPDKILRQIDVALIGLHGEYGEDGEVQKVLETFGVPYTGSDSYGSFLAIHKALAKEKAKESGIMTPGYRLVAHRNEAEDVSRDVIRAFRQPVIVKPVRWGSSVGVSIVGGYQAVLDAIETLFEQGADSVLIEEYIRGREATAGVVENLRGEKLYALPVVEILPPENDFYSYDAKYSGSSGHQCPANFSRVISEELARASKVMHRTLGLRHYSRSDFIVSPAGDIYYLETNTLPGITAESNVPLELKAMGITLRDFLTHIVGLALVR